MRKQTNSDKPFIIAFVMICTIVLILCGINSWYDKTHYTNVCYIDSISDNEVLMIDCCGDIWAVDAIKGAKVGDLVNVYFYNNGTTYTHKDDIITHINIL